MESYFRVFFSSYVSAEERRALIDLLAELVFGFDGHGAMMMEAQPCCQLIISFGV
jgi:hypothetical protein